MTTRKYAKGTEVSVRQSLAELEDLIERFAGGQPTAFAYGTMGNVATVQFEIRGRRVRLSLRLPDEEAFRFTEKQNQFSSWKVERTATQIRTEREREVKRLWRSLVDVVKAKLVAIDDGITTLEAEFLGSLVLPSGETVGERMAVDLEATLKTGELPPLMPGLPSAPRVIAIGEGRR